MDPDTGALRTGTTVKVEAEKPPESVPQYETIKSGINSRERNPTKALTITVT